MKHIFKIAVIILLVLIVVPVNYYYFVYKPKLDAGALEASTDLVRGNYTACSYKVLNQNVVAAKSVYSDKEKQDLKLKCGSAARTKDITGRMDCYLFDTRTKEEINNSYLVVSALLQNSTGKELNLEKYAILANTNDENKVFISQVRHDFTRSTAKGQKISAGGSFPISGVIAVSNDNKFYKYGDAVVVEILPEFTGCTK